PERDPFRVELVLGVLVDDPALDHDEPAHVHRRLRDAERRGLLWRQGQALLREPQVAARGADDAPDEEVEKHEKGSLEDEECALDVYRCGDHARLKTSSVEPTVMRSSLLSWARCWRRPLTVRPFV